MKSLICFFCPEDSLAFAFVACTLSDFTKDLLHGVEHVTLTIELCAKNLDDFAVTQLLVLCLNLTLLAKYQRLRTVGITVGIEALDLS